MVAVVGCFLRLLPDAAAWKAVEVEVPRVCCRKGCDTDCCWSAAVLREIFRGGTAGADANSGNFSCQSILYNSNSIIRRWFSVFDTI